MCGEDEERESGSSVPHAGISAERRIVKGQLRSQWWPTRQSAPIWLSEIRPLDIRPEAQEPSIHAKGRESPSRLTTLRWIGPATTSRATESIVSLGCFTDHRYRGGSVRRSPGHPALLRMDALRDLAGDERFYGQTRIGGPRTRSPVALEWIAVTRLSTVGNEHRACRGSYLRFV